MWTLLVGYERSDSSIVNIHEEDLLEFQTQVRGSHNPPVLASLEKKKPFAVTFRIQVSYKLWYATILVCTSSQAVRLVLVARCLSSLGCFLDVRPRIGRKRQFLEAD